jgi:hypothetical protein
MAEEKAIYFQEHRIYKPKQDNSGSASKLQLKQVPGKYGPECYLFWVGTHQTGVDQNGNASFAWDDPTQSVTIKLEIPDIGEILSVLRHQKKFVGPEPKEGSKPMGLFHKNPRGNTTMQLQRMDNGSLAFRLAAKRDDGPLVEVKHMITLAEGEILEILFTSAARRMYDW